MTRTTPFNMRCRPQEKSDAEWAASRNGEDLSAMTRRLWREEFELRQAEAGEQADRKAERELTLETAFPQGPKKCRHVRMGQYCYVCREKRFG